jgi:hypothetical protein
MSGLNRRQFVKLTGAGTGLAFGAGVTGAQGRRPGTEQEVVAEFTGTVSDGFIVINGNSPTDSGAGISVPISEIDGDVIIDGEIYDDKTWSSSNVTFPDIDPSKLIDPDNIDLVQSIDFDESATEINVVVDGISGTYDPEQNLVIGDIDMLIDVVVEGTAVADVIGNPEISFDLEFEIDVNEGADITLTTEESNGQGTTAGLEGSAQNLAGENAAATVVSNEFVVPQAEGDVEECVAGIECLNVNDQLGLPSEPEGRNWIKLDLDIVWAGDPPQFGLPTLPGGQDSPQDIDGDGNHEDVTGDGSVDVFDTQVLFDNLDNDALQENAGAFNFSPATPDDEVTILDVASHWKQNVFE